MTEETGLQASRAWTTLGTPMHPESIETALGVPLRRAWAAARIRSPLAQSRQTRGAPVADLWPTPKWTGAGVPFLRDGFVDGRSVVQ